MKWALDLITLYPVTNNQRSHFHCDANYIAYKRPTENELSDFSRLWHDGCGKTII